LEPPATEPPRPEEQQEIVRETVTEELVSHESEEQIAKIGEPTSAANQETPQTPEATPASRRTVTSWASLLRGPSTASSAPGAKALPTSSVVGFSIPADTSILTRSPIDMAVLKLLTGKSGRSSEPHILVPRGLINLGNMCFANIILQGLVYTQPFWSLLRELRKLHPTPLSTPKGTPLLNARSEFLVPLTTLF
jgi:ubiquitin carboxyl-terminal hydrolase 10